MQSASGNGNGKETQDELIRYYCLPDKKQNFKVHNKSLSHLTFSAKSQHKSQSQAGENTVTKGRRRLSVSALGGLVTHKSIQPLT